MDCKEGKTSKGKELLNYCVSNKHAFEFDKVKPILTDITQLLV